MIKQLKEQNRLNETLFMGVLTLVCFGFSVFRLFYTHSLIFFFLNWNLFLAFVPWAFTSITNIRPGIKKNKIAVSLLLIAWLLFFPNAPYILTDLFHLRLRSSMPIWYDLVLILSYAWTGLLFGLLSLWDIENILKELIHSKWIKVLSVIFLFVGSFGVYVGRYLRWNSWDLFTEPSNIMQDIGNRMIDPMAHPRAWGMTIFMGVFLNMIYWSLRLIRKREDKN